MKFSGGGCSISKEVFGKMEEVGKEGRTDI